MQKAVVYLALFLAFACLVVGLLVAGDVPALTDAERDRERIENAARGGAACFWLPWAAWSWSFCAGSTGAPRRFGLGLTVNTRWCGCG